MPTRRRLRAPRRAIALAGGALLLAGGGAVAAVTTGGSPVDEILGGPPLEVAPGGERVDVAVLDPANERWYASAYESFGIPAGLPDSEEGRVLCTLATQGAEAGALPRDLVTRCKAPALIAADVQRFGTLSVNSDATRETAATSHVAYGLVPANVRSIEVITADGGRRAGEVSAPFDVDASTVEASAPDERDLVPGARAPALPEGPLSLRLAAAATAEPPEAAILTYADGRTESVPLGG